MITDLRRSVIGAVPLLNALGSELSAAGYANVLTYQPVTGFRVVDLGAKRTSEETWTRLGLAPVNGAAPAGIELLGATLERFVSLDGSPLALIIDFASRLIVRSDTLSPTEHQLFLRALVLSHAAHARPFGEHRVPFFNTVIWIVDKEGDLPDWFLIGNPRAACAGSETGSTRAARHCRIAPSQSSRWPGGCSFGPCGS